MARKHPQDRTMEYENALAGQTDQNYVLRLYITGSTPRSLRAVKNVKLICDEYLLGRYELEIIDIHEKKTLGRDEQILATPTLIRKLPLPLRRLIGDMTEKDRILLGLDLIPRRPI